MKNDKYLNILLFANSIFYRPRHEKYHNYVITVSILLNLLQLCYRRIVTFLINIVNCFLGRGDRAIRAL